LRICLQCIYFHARVTLYFSLRAGRTVCSKVNWRLCKFHIFARNNYTSLKPYIFKKTAIVCVKKMLKRASNFSIRIYLRWSGRITKSQCLTTSGFCRSEERERKIRRFFFLVHIIILGKGRVTSATGIVPSFDRKIIVQWRSGIYPTYIFGSRDRSWNRSNVSRCIV